MRYYTLDCEFDGHNGPLISLALVPSQSKRAPLYVICYSDAQSAWVRENVLPVLEKHPREVHPRYCHVAMAGEIIRNYLPTDEQICVIADSVADIARFCRAIGTSVEGEYCSIDHDLRFEVTNEQAYPTELSGAIQHNAYWDAAALRHAIFIV